MQSTPDIHLLDILPSLEDGFVIAETGNVDVVIIDFPLNPERVQCSIEAFHRRYPSIPVINGEGDSVEWGVLMNIQAGAAGFLNHCREEGELIKMIRRCAIGEYPVNEHLLDLPDLAEHIIDQMYAVQSFDGTNSDCLPVFSANEREILRDIFRAGKGDAHTIDKKTIAKIRHKLATARYRGWDSGDPVGRTRFLIASEDPEVRQHFTKIIGADPSYELVAQIGAPDQIRDIARELFCAESDAAAFNALTAAGIPADIVVLGPLSPDQFPERGGQRYPLTPAVIIVTAEDSRLGCVVALTSAARAYCPLQMDAEALESLIMKFRQGRWPTSDLFLSTAIIHGYRKFTPCPLNELEVDFLVCYGSGWSNREIADERGMSYDEYKVFESEMLSKLGVSDLDEAAEIASSQGFWWGPYRAEPSPLEIDVLRLIRDDLTDEEIASRLGITLREVHELTESLFKQLGATNRTAAVRKALDMGLIIFGAERWKEENPWLNVPSFYGD